MPSKEAKAKQVGAPPTDTEAPFPLTPLYPAPAEAPDCDEDVVKNPEDVFVLNPAPALKPLDAVEKNPDEAPAVNLAEELK